MIRVAVPDLSHARMKAGDLLPSNPILLFCQLQGYYIDLDLAFKNTCWTQERVKEKKSQTH